jgi:hypothetical protein
MWHHDHNLSLHAAPTRTHYGIPGIMKAAYVQFKIENEALLQFLETSFQSLLSWIDFDLKLLYQIINF